MKIKRKVEKSLPQLIEWLLESGKSKCIVISNMNNIVQLEPYGVIRFSQEKFYPEDFFTVTIEEEIDEDTELDYLYMLTDTKDIIRCNYPTINVAKKFFGGEVFTFFTLVGNDLIKIYENGKLVE